NLAPENCASTYPRAILARNSSGSIFVRACRTACCIIEPPEWSPIACLLLLVAVEVTVEGQPVGRQHVARVRVGPGEPWPGRDDNPAGPLPDKTRPPAERTVREHQPVKPGQEQDHLKWVGARRRVDGEELSHSRELV